jgi:hypothetical protein
MIKQYCYNIIIINTTYYNMIVPEVNNSTLCIRKLPNENGDAINMEDEIFVNNKSNCDNNIKLLYEKKQNTNLIIVVIIINIIFALLTVTIFTVIEENLNKYIYNLIYIKSISDIIYNIFLFYHILFFNMFVKDNWIKKIRKMFALLNTLYSVSEILWVCMMFMEFIINIKKINIIGIIVIIFNIILPKSLLLLIFI